MDLEHDGPGQDSGELVPIPDDVAASISSFNESWDLPEPLRVEAPRDLVGKSMLLPAFGKASLPIWSTIWRSCGMQLPLRPIGSSKGETA